MISRRNGANTNNIVLHPSVENSIAFQASGDAIVADIETWHLYTGTYDGNFWRIYVDGEFKLLMSIFTFLAVQSPSKIIELFITFVSKCKMNTDSAEITNIEIPKKKNKSPDLS